MPIGGGQQVFSPCELRIRVRLQSARSRERRRDKLRISQRIDYYTNRERRLAQNKASVARRKDKVATYKQSWADKNRERVRLNHLNWRNKNRVHVRIQSKQIKAKRRAIEQGCSIGDLKKIIEWENSWESKDLVNCFWCNISVPPSKCHSDHIIAFKHGGAHCVENLCIACRRCNLKKNARSVEQWVKWIRKNILFWHESDSYKWCILKGFYDPSLVEGRPKSTLYCF